MNPFPTSKNISTFALSSDKILKFNKSRIPGLPIKLLLIWIDPAKSIISRNFYNIL